MLVDNISVNALWSRILDALKNQVNRPTYEGWIKSIEPESLTDDCLTLRTNAFGKNLLVKYYAQLIKSTATEIMGYPLEINIVAVPSPVLSPEEVPKLSPQPPAKAPLPQPQIHLQSVCGGATNRMAHAAALLLPRLQGESSIPCFSVGVGLGKTHLMQAIAHYRLEIQPNAKIAYVSTEQFTNELITAIRKDSMQSFRDQYREIDMILVDDIQFIEGKEYTQEEFFHTFNALYESGKQVVLASDRPLDRFPACKSGCAPVSPWV